MSEINSLLSSGDLKEFFVWVTSEGFPQKQVSEWLLAHKGKNYIDAYFYFKKKQDKLI
jgi:hypothetical protein